MSSSQAKNGPRTGPRTPHGRISIINANVINGSRCFVPVLPGESEIAWRELLDGVRARIQPADRLEEEMVSTCLAPLERSSSGDFGYETGGALGAGGG